MLATRRRITAALSLLVLPFGTWAQDDVDTSSTNLMVVLRESINANFPQSSQLKYIGRVRFRTNDGKEIEAELAHYAYLADTHIRFVFDGPSSMRNATAADLSRLGLSPERALDLAVSNIRRVYGEAKSIVVRGRLQELNSKSPDLISSYFLDTAFWSAMEREHPDGIVAIVPRRGGLLFAPADDKQAGESLRGVVSRLFASSERLRVSSAVFLFKGGKWSTLQDPVSKE